MAINFSTGAFRDQVQVGLQKRAVPKKGALGAGKAALTEDIPTSDSLTGIELRIQQIFIRDNGTTWVWPFIRYSDLYVVLATVDDLGGDPFKVALEGFADVDDGETLPLERTAYYWTQSKDRSTAPSQVHWVLSVIKSSKRIRKMGAALSKLKGTDDYKQVVATVLKAVASGASAVADGLLALTGVIGGLLADVEDTPLITQVLSFTSINGDFDALGKHVHTKGNRFINLEVALTTRDAKRAGKG